MDGIWKDIENELKRTSEKLHTGLREVNDRPDFTPQSIEVLYKLLDEIKDDLEICKHIKEMDESEGYSGRMSRGWQLDARRIPDYSYMSRPYNRMYMDRSDGNYNGQYSGHSKGEKIHVLRELMNDADSEEEYNFYHKKIMHLENQ